MGTYSFLKTEKFGLREQVTFVGNTLNIYLAKSYFDVSPTLATLIGDKVETIGLFWFEVSGKWYEMQLPIPMMFQFREKTEKKLILRPGMKEDKYIIFTLKAGDAFMWDTNNKKDAGQIKFVFGKLIEGAKMPKTLPYTEALPVLLNALAITEAGDLGVSAVTFEFLLSVLYRSKKTGNKEFRFDYDGKNEFDFIMQRITSLTRAAGTFTSIIGEDLGTGLVNGILRTRNKLKDAETPIEKVIKY